MLTPLHIAASKGNMFVLNLVFVNANEIIKVTPLHLAAQNGNFDIMSTYH